MKAEQVEELAVSLIDAAPMYHRHIRVLRDLALRALSLESVREEALEEAARLCERIAETCLEERRGFSLSLAERFAGLIEIYGQQSQGFARRDQLRTAAKLIRDLQHAPARVAEGEPVHIDHPLRHWDRTCPACIADYKAEHDGAAPPESPAKEQPGEQKLGQGWIPVSEDLKLAKEIIERDNRDNRGSRILRPGLTDEYRLARASISYARALQEAAAIGVANLLTYCGAYESLNPYKQKLWDRLNELHSMCDGLPPPPERP